MPNATLTRATVYNQGRDDYGRGTYYNYSRKGIIVVLPRRTAHVRPEGQNYLVNLHDGTLPGTNTIAYFKTLNAAKDFYIQNAPVRTYSS